MRNKLGLGAGFALTAAVIAIGGCGSKKTTINGSNAGELNNNGFPASPIAQNNLAADGGGFSENNQTASLGRFTCKFNYPHPNSDAPSTADKSGMFFYVTADNGTTATNREHVFISYWNGSSFTPPQEITGQDRDESLTVGDAKATHTSSVILMPLNTSAYVGNTGVANARVRANAGNWLVLWDANTFTQSAQLTNAITATTSTTGVQTPDAVGPHHTVYATIFVKALASQPLATTNLIGNTAVSGTANGPAIECHYGFQYQGTEIVANRNGAGLGTQALTAGQTGFVSGGSNLLVKPAEDLASYGVATDTIVSCANFTGGSGLNNVNDDLGGLLTGTKIGNFGGGASALGPNTAQGTAAAGGTATPGAASYEVGDNTSFIQIFYTQLVTSGANANRVSTTFVPTASNGTVQLGPSWQLFTANFNLSTMTVGGTANPSAPTGQTIVTAPATRNTFTDGRRASTQPHANFSTYNNLLFWSYDDASLAVAQSGGTGTVEGTINGTAGPGGVSRILSEVAVLLGANGDASIGNQNDITILGSAGRHQTINSQPVSSFVDVGEEFNTLGLCNGCGIIGPDEGQQDVVVFSLGRVTTVTTRGGANLSNTDQEIWATAFTATGAQAGTLEAFTNNPKRVSVHTAADVPVPLTTSTNFLGFHDPVDDVKLQLSRDGTYSLIAWRQATGTSITANLSLMATAYKVFRTVAANGSATTPTVPTLDQRFPAAPTQVNTTSTVAYGSSLTTGFGTGYTTGFVSSPVAAYDFEGHIGYHCGFQSDRTKISIFWLYSDGTNDRLFAKLLTTSTGTLATDAPTLTPSGEAEIDATAAVPAVGVNNLQSTSRTSFNFIPGTFDETIPQWSTFGGGPLSAGPNFVGCSTLFRNPGSPWTVLDSADAGVNATGGGGDVLVVFSKVVSATDNAYDKQIIGALYNQTTISDRVVLSRSFVESSGQAPSGAASFSFPNGGGLGTSANYAGNYGGFRTQLANLTPNSTKASISTPAYAADNGVYVYFNGPASNNATSASVLYTRHFRARKATSGGTAVTFANTFFPAASAATGDAAFKNPVRIDNGGEDATATFVTVLHKGHQAVVLFNQDNHLWGTVSSDGETYTNTNGLPSALLVDNNISASTNFGRPVIGQNPCVLVDSNCDNLSGTALFILKEDVNGNQRLYARVMQ